MTGGGGIGNCEDVPCAPNSCATKAGTNNKMVAHVLQYFTGNAQVCVCAEGGEEGFNQNKNEAKTRLQSLLPLQNLDIPLLQ